MNLPWTLVEGLIDRLEESDKALSAAAARDPIMWGQTSIFFQLGMQNKELMQQGLALFSSTMGEFKASMVGLISKFQAGTLSVPAAMAQWKSMTGGYYQQLFKAGAMAVGNPYYDKLGMTRKDLAFMSKARRFEGRFFRNFLGDIQRDPTGQYHQRHPYLQRAGYYSESGAAQFYNGMLNGAGDNVEIHWVLGVPREEHCEVCPTLAQKVWTWQTLPTVPRAGDTPCLYRCYCHLEIKHAAKSQVQVPQMPGSATPAALEAPGRWARVADLRGNELAGMVLSDFEGLYQQLYKARQMIGLTKGTERMQWIRSRIDINQAIIDRMRTAKVRAVPTVSVRQLTQAVQDMRTLYPTSNIVAQFSSLAEGQEIAFIRGDFSAEGVVTIHNGVPYFVDAKGQLYQLNSNSDIVLALAPPPAPIGQLTPQMKADWDAALKVMKDLGFGNVKEWGFDTTMRFYKEFLADQTQAQITSQLLEGWGDGVGIYRNLLKKVMERIADNPSTSVGGNLRDFAKDAVAFFNLPQTFYDLPYAKQIDIVAKASQEAFEKIYTAQQAYLKSLHPSGSITLYRGISADEYEAIMAAGARNATFDSVQGMSSDYNVAKTFANRYHGYLLQVEVPIDRVAFSTDMRWVPDAYRGEREWMVMGGKGLSIKRIGTITNYGSPHPNVTWEDV